MSNVIDFSAVTENPAQLAVFVIDTQTGFGRRIYQVNTDASLGPLLSPSSGNPYMYTVSWVDQTIEVVTYGDTPLLSTEEIQIEVYEFGNGNQLVRSTSQGMPLQIDPITNNSEIHLGYASDTDPVANPVVYHNGNKLVFNTDYYLSSTSSGNSKLLFTSVYDPTVDYLSFVVFASTVGTVNISGVITSATAQTTVTGISSTQGLTPNMLISQISGTGEFNGASTKIISVDTDNQITILTATKIDQDKTINVAGTVAFNVSVPNVINYSIPETQVFVYTTLSTFTLTNYTGGDNQNNAIVNVNGYRLSLQDGDYSIALGVLTVTVALTVGDLISVTTFNDTTNQYLNTQQFVGKTVLPLVSIDITKFTVWLYLLAPEDASTLAAITATINGKRILIDGVVGTTQINVTSYNTPYYAKVGTVFYDDPADLTSTRYLPITLYLDLAFTAPVPTLNWSSYEYGGVIWAYDDTIQVDQPNLTLTNIDRLHVTVQKDSLNPAGAVVSYDLLRLNNRLGVPNYISILAAVDPTDVILITSMVSASTPGQLTYVTEVDNNGEQIIYRANSDTRTWLTKPLQRLDDTLYVADISKIVDIVTETLTVVAGTSQLYVLLKYDLQSIKQVSVYNVTGMVEIASSDFLLTSENAKPQLVLKQNAIAGDQIIVTIRLGDVVVINGEKIRYKQVNYVNNSISALTRGIGGTGEIKIHNAFDTVYSISPTNTLFNFYYNRTWNSEIYNPMAGDPLQISDSIPALFLQPDQNK